MREEDRWPPSGKKPKAPGDELAASASPTSPGSGSRKDEWEKAARGEKGLIYPWGNEYLSGFANIDETKGMDGPWNLQQTTAVGMYPHGRSPYGVEDLSGTEWCLNKFDNPNEVAANTGGQRGLRGGSWLGNSVRVRANLRSGALPDLRLVNWGFRVSSSVPIAVR